MILILISIAFGVIEQPLFEQELLVRNFEEAILLAGESDSLKALVFDAAGDNAAAAVLFDRAFRLSPSDDLFAMLWSVLAEDSRSTGESLLLFREESSRWIPLLEWSSETLLSLVQTASALGDSLLADSLTNVILEKYPLSDEAYELLGWEFWDVLYPVWYNDSAKIVVLEDFIENRGGYSDVWRSHAWRYLLDASLGTADSTHWEELINFWLESCPEHPQPYLTGAGLYLERDSDCTKAIELAETGLRLLEAGWYPIGMSDEEWEITEDAMKANLLMKKCQALLSLGNVSEAYYEVSTISGGSVFGINDYHTRAPYLWLEGKCALALGDTAQAIDAWLESLVLGDERNRWADSSLVSLMPCLPSNVSPESYGRESMDYDGPIFEDVTFMLGSDSTVRGSRVSWCDWNADGWPDLLLGGDLYRNDSGTGFTRVTGSVLPDSIDFNGGIWGDIDCDGLPDLVTPGNPVRVLLNREGQLIEMTEELGLIPPENSVEGVGLLDWNADGWLDIYLASYEKSGSIGEGTADQFYLGSSHGFREVSDSIGMEPFLGLDLCGRGVSPCDYDRDGDMDIFVSNYRLEENFLWENTGNGALNSALMTGTAGRENEGWWGHTIGSIWGDCNGDGEWDLFSANLAHPRYISFSNRSELLLQENGSFADFRAAAGISYEETHSNPVWGDFDNDGLLDLYITSIYENRRSFLYRCSNLLPEYTDVSFLSGTRVYNGWGAAAADFNIDGRLDLVIGSGSGPVLLMNVTDGGNWLLVRVISPQGTNPSGLGCTVEITQGNRIFIRQISGGSGTTSQDASVLHFGLPSDNPVDIKLFVPGEAAHVWEDKNILPDTLITIGNRLKQL